MAEGNQPDVLGNEVGARHQFIPLSCGTNPSPLGVKKNQSSRLKQRQAGGWDMMLVADTLEELDGNARVDLITAYKYSVGPSI